MPKRLPAPKAARYKAEFANRGSDGPLDIKPYVFAIEFEAQDDEEATDTVNAILNGVGMVLPPPTTRFELWRLLDRSGKVILG